MRPIAPVAAILLATLAAASSDGVGPVTQRLAHQVHRMKWNANRPAGYTYRLQLLCECLPEFTQPVRITVHGLEVQEVVSATTGDPIAPEQAAHFQITIDSLFNRVEAALGGAADQVTARYDARLGYPREVQIDYERQSADDEIAFTAQVLAP